MTSTEALQELREYCEKKQKRMDQRCNFKNASIWDRLSYSGQSNGYYDVIAKIDEMIKKGE